MQYPIIDPTRRSSALTGRRGFLGLLAGLLGAPLAAHGSTAGSAAGHPRGLDDERAAWLREWSQLPRIPVQQGHDPLVATLLQHSLDGQPLALFYSGGSHPGRMRRFSPDFLFRHERNPTIYVSGFCHREQAPRILRLDRIALA